MATVASLADRGILGPGKASLETGAGVIPIEIGKGDSPQITMTQVRPEFGPHLRHRDLRTVALADLDGDHAGSGLQRRLAGSQDAAVGQRRHRRHRRANSLRLDFVRRRGR